MKKRKILLLISIYLSIDLLGQEPIILSQSSLKVNGASDKEVLFGFSKGDKIIFDFKETQGKKFKKVEINELTTGNKYREFEINKIQNKVLTADVTGIYKFRFVNSALGKRLCSYIIKRVPENTSTVNFNSTVFWKTLYDTTYTTTQEKYLIRKEYIPKTLVPISEHYINSGSNATFRGGTSRISIPVTLPENTQQWYYEFTASRNKDDTEKTKGAFNLIGELTKLIDHTGSLDIAVDMLTKPPGGDICDIYLLDLENSRLFESKTNFSYYPIGSRQNIKSGIVKVDVGDSQTFILGIKNPDDLNGIHVAIEVVAIVLEEEWGIRDVEKMKVRKRKEPYLKN